MYEETESKTTKVCAHCKQEKPVHEFGIKKTAKDGLNCYCKDCIRAFQKKTADKRRENNRRLMLLEKEGVNNLSNYTPRQLMEELARRGYKGVLKYTNIIDIEKL